MSKIKINLKLLVLLLALMSVKTAAITVDAGDYTRLPDGTNLAVLYMQRTNGSELYIDDNKVSSNADLKANVGIVRGVRFIDWGGLTIAPQFLLPFGTVDTGGDLSALDSANGVGDLIINPTIHLMQDPERKKSFAVTPWLYVPTGDYNRNKDINAFGENRWKLALQMGYIAPISDKWTADVLADVMFFGDNDDYTSDGLTLKQEPLYEVQGHLRYNISPKTYIAGSASYIWGGETEIEGEKQSDKQKRTKILITLGHFVTPTWQILVSYGEDAELKEGIAEESRLNMRLLKVF